MHVTCRGSCIRWRWLPPTHDPPLTLDALVSSGFSVHARRRPTLRPPPLFTRSALGRFDGQFAVRRAAVDAPRG